MKRNLMAVLVFLGMFSIQRSTAWWLWSSKSSAKEEKTKKVEQPIETPKVDIPKVETEEEIKAAAYKKVADMKEEKRKNLAVVSDVVGKLTKSARVMLMLGDVWDESKESIYKTKRESIDRLEKELKLGLQKSEYILLSTMTVALFPETLLFIPMTKHEKYTVMALLDEMIDLLENDLELVQSEEISDYDKHLYTGLVVKLFYLQNKLSHFKDENVNEPQPAYADYDAAVQKYQAIARSLGNSKAKNKVVAVENELLEK